MIRYALRCAQGHMFDSWFASGAEFDRLQGAKLLSCAVCGDAQLEKDLMAPSLAAGTPAPTDEDRAASGRSPGRAGCHTLRWRRRAPAIGGALGPRSGGRRHESP